MKVINKYRISIDENGYVNGFSVVSEGGDFVGQMSDYPDACEGWTKFLNGQFIEDLEKKAEIIAQREAEAAKPTQLDIVEAQVTYTALMTDTLIDVVEEDE
ncbi:MAG: hypothetical protein IJK53_08190 [Erysipelotrichaceae bacterium]|nr:hypothetical protein [Erysipelotrichaceae bacterium]